MVITLVSEKSKNAFVLIERKQTVAFALCHGRFGAIFLALHCQVSSAVNLSDSQVCGLAPHAENQK